MAPGAEVAVDLSVSRRLQEPAGAGATDVVERIVRHRLADRVLHWLTAICVLTLLGTAFLPILGLDFSWVTIHWLTGGVLIIVVVFHALRALLFQSVSSMWIGKADIKDAVALARWSLRRDERPPPKPGKYSFAQKLIHHLFTLVVLTAMGTGALMLTKIDSPWWRSNPYWLSDGTWGVIYVLHDLAALLLITMVMTHIYFALRPEKLFFTRSMLLGWITRKEYGAHHDPARWRVPE